MKKFLLFLVCFGVCLGSLLPAADAEELIRKGETLDLQRCIAITMERHPGIQAAAGTLRAGDSRIGQARSGYYPQLNGSAGYSRTDPTTSAGQVYDSYSSSVSLSQNLYDFGKTSTQVKIQEFNRDSFRSDLDNIRTQVSFGVKQAYFGLLQAGRNRDVSREMVEQFRQHLDQARAFFEVGAKPKFDVTKAEVDLSNAKLNLIKAENALRLARVALNNAMGLSEAPDYEVADQLSSLRAEIDLNEILRKAYDRRPDLKAIAVKRKSLEQSIELARKGYYPSVTGNAGYGWGGGSFPLDQGWSFGAQLNIPLFNGYSTKYQVTEAQANLEVLAANDALLRQTIDQDVRQAWLNLQEAADRGVAAELIVRQAAENLELANGRYASGVGSPIEVTDALVAASNAKTAQISALYDYKLAQSSLEKAAGEP
ncbi:MAG: TolC family protein [Syntrophobacterales bacterium CG03_land_8_20_14_0_80_58_14]|nr:MAG: TolC family protein [Syntrophobacterales bacterium CG03_land_8_20_14_0_80_58_14]